MTNTLDILDRLVGFATVSRDSNLAIIDYIQDFLTTRGFVVHRVMDETGQKAGLFASIGPAGGGIMLSGHTDVVPVAGQNWTRDPFRLTREGDRVYGRGTTDMKGYLACMLTLADRAAGADLNEPLKLAFSYDEELGCLGIKQMIGQLDRCIGMPRACLVGEPTQMQVAIGHKGKAALRATCHGQNGHSALAPMFVNAAYVAVDFVNELRLLQDHYADFGYRDTAYKVPYSTVHVGKFNAGMALNIVPDKAIVDFEFRHLAEDAPEDIVARITAAADKITQQHRRAWSGAGVEIERIFAYPGLQVDADAAIVTLAQSLAQSSTTKVAFGTEAGYFDGLGIATVVCGPGSMQGQGHKPDEYVELSQLAACDAMLGRVLAQLTAR